jgi:chromosomal replication initiator protein
LEGCAITRELVNSFVAASASVRVSLEQVTAEVASHFGVSVRELRSGRRAQSVSVARRAAMYLARRLTAHSAEAIVRYFHKRHASTVSHACRTLTRQMEQDAQLRAELEALASALTGGAVSGWIGPS